MQTLALQSLVMSPGSFNHEIGDTLYTEQLSFVLHKILYQYAQQGGGFEWTSAQDETDAEGWLDSVLSAVPTLLTDLGLASSFVPGVSTISALPVLVKKGAPLVKVIVRMALPLLFSLAVDVALNWLSRWLSPGTSPGGSIEIPQAMLDSLAQIGEASEASSLSLQKGLIEGEEGLAKIIKSSLQTEEGLALLGKVEEAILKVFLTGEVGSEKSVILLLKEVVEKALLETEGETSNAILAQVRDFIKQGLLYVNPENSEQWLSTLFQGLLKQETINGVVTTESYLKILQEAVELLRSVGVSISFSGRSVRVDLLGAASDNVSET